MTKDSLSGIVFISLSAFFWAALELLAHSMPSGYGAFQIVWMRYATHLLFIVVAFGPHYRADLVRTNQFRLQCFRPTLMIAMPLCFLFGIKFMSLENIWSVFWIAPLMSMLMALFLLGEHISAPSWISAIFGLVGVLCILCPDKGLLTWSMLFPLGMAFCYSLYVIMTRLLRTERTVTNLFFTAIVVLLPWSLGLPLFWRQLNLRAAGVMAAIGLLGLVVSVLLRQSLRPRTSVGSGAVHLCANYFLGYFKLFHVRTSTRSEDDPRKFDRD